MTTTPSDTGEPSEDQKNESDELPPYWKAQLSKSTAPGRVYYFNFKNRCSVWRLEETKIKINNTMPKNAQKERAEPIEPSESPDDQARLESRHDQTERGSDENSSRSTQEIQSRSTAVNSNLWVHPGTNAQPLPSAFTPDAAPMLLNPNVWPVPPRNDQSNKQLGMTMFNSMLPNLPTYGQMAGYPGWGYPYQTPFANPPPSFPVAVPNNAPFQFGGQPNFARTFPQSVMFNVPPPPNPISHASYSIPATVASVSTDVSNSERFVDGRQLTSERGEQESPESTNDLEVQPPKRVTFEKKTNLANRLQQPKSLPADDLRLRLKEIHRKRRNSTDKIEESDSKRPLLIARRRKSCPENVELSVEEPVPQSPPSAEKSIEEEDVPPQKGESYGCWLLTTAKPGVSTEFCYIAVDTNVYLTDLDLIKSLIESDTDNVCRILVPWRVNNELGNLCKRRSLASLRIRANKANTFIRDELGRRDCAIVVQSPFEASKKLFDCYGPDDEIVNCCVQYVKKNFHVILLSDDKNLSTKVFSSGIEPYTRAEMKTFMEDTKQILKESKMSMKISVPNTLALSKSTEPPVMPQTSDSTFDQNLVRNFHTTVTNVEVQPPITANFQIPPPAIFPASFNPLIPPPHHLVIPNQPMFLNTQPRVAPNNAPAPWDAFTTNMMTTLTNEERSNNADTTSLTSSKSSSTKDSSNQSKKLAMPTVNASSEDKVQKTTATSRFIKKVVWEPKPESKTENPVVKSKKIVLRRTRWNSSTDPSASNTKLTVLKNLPKVPIFSNAEPVASAPVTISTTAITSSAVSSENANLPLKTVHKYAVQSSVNLTEPKELPSQSKIPAEAQKTMPVLKRDMWVSKRTQKIVMDSQNVKHAEDPKSLQNPNEKVNNNANAVKKHAFQLKRDLSTTRSNEAVTPNVFDIGIDRILAKKLQRRMDEWTCILVQTMEDILSIILQQELCGLPPPWSIHEAASGVMHQFRQHNKQASAIGGRLAMELNSATRTTTRGGITFLTPLPSTAEQFMKIHGSCIQLLTALKESNQSPELEKADRTLSDLIGELKKGEIDIVFDNLDATQKKRDEILEKPTDNADENEYDGDFIKNRYEDVDINAEIIGYLKKHYSEWSSYQENDAQNKNKENKKVNRGLKTQRDVANVLEPNAGNDKLVIRPGNNANKKVPESGVVHNAVDSKRTHTSETEKVVANIVEPRIIRNLNLIPEFEERCNINNELEEWEWGDEDVDDEEYYEDLDYGQEYEGWDEEMEYDAGNYIDGNVENETNNIENIHSEDTHLHEKIEGPKDVVVNQNKQHAINIVDENRELIEKNVETVEENMEIVEANTETIEENNNFGPIKFDNVDKSRSSNDEKKKFLNNVAHALRLSFLNVLAYSVEKCDGLDKKELAPIVLEGDSSGLPGVEELACHVDNFVNNLTGLLEGGRCDARELRECLRRLAPRLSLPRSADVLDVCRKFDKGHLGNAMKNMQQLQQLLKKLSSDQKRRRN